MAAMITLACPSTTGADLSVAIADYDRGNYAAALPELKRLSELGDAAAQVRLGRLYERGEGVAQDYGAALRRYRAAAAQGDATGQAYLGDLYSLGLGMPPDWTEAVRWYRLAAAQHEPSSMASLGFAYQTGQGVPQDWAMGLHWYGEAAQLGDPQAQYRLGEILDHGEHGVTVDLQEARSRYEKAARRGHRQAAAALARFGGPADAPLPSAPLPTTPTPAVLAAGVAAYEAKDYADARRLLWPLADSGYAQAQYVLGDLAYYSLDGVRNAAEGVRRYRQAAEQGHTLAAVMLGMAYESGAGVDKDPVQALAWYRRAADAGDAWGQYHVGAYHERGWGGLTADITEARRWYELAAAHEHEGARVSLAQLAYLKPPAPAETIATQALELAPVADAYNGGDYARAFTLLKPLAEQGQTEAQTLLGDLYLHGRGVTRDIAVAVAWYRKASERSYGPALRALAKCYEVGLGVPRDMDAAERFYKRAAEEEIFHLGGEGAAQ
jgi:hypothetical protein